MSPRPAPRPGDWREHFRHAFVHMEAAAWLIAHGDRVEAAHHMRAVRADLLWCERQLREEAAS